MSIRGFRKNMKPVIWFVTILMVGSGLFLTWSEFRSTSSRTTQNYAFKLNGEKISLLEVEQAKNAYSEQFGRAIGKTPDAYMTGVLSFDEVINRELSLDLAKKANIKVDNGEVDKVYKMQKDAIESQNGQFKRWLSGNGYTRSTYKTKIKDDLTVEKYVNSFIEKAKGPSEDEIKKLYDSNAKLRFADKTYDEVKNDIVTEVKNNEGVTEYFKAIADARKAAKITDINANYEAFAEKPEITDGDFVVTNTDITRQALKVLPYPNMDRTKAEAFAKDMYQKQINLAKKAKSEGITVDDTLPIDMRLAAYQDSFFEKIKSEIKPTEEDLKKYFTENKILYDIYASADADIAVLRVKYSDKDLANNKEEAQKLLKEITVDNFKEMAKKYSKDGTAKDGGELGEFKRGTMVPSFENAVFSGKVGEIYPEPVTSEFGEHIIYIEARDDANGTAKASHILLLPTMSKETKDAEDKKVQNIVNDLKSGKTDFAKLKAEDNDILFSDNIKNINKEGYIAGIGTLKELTDKIFAEKIGDIGSMSLDNMYFIYKKTNEIQPKMAEYNDFKDKVKENYLDSKAKEEFSKFFE